MIKGLQWLCSRILPSKSTTAAQTVLFQRETKQNPLPPTQLNPHRQHNFRLERAHLQNPCSFFSWFQSLSQASI